jgi:predicted transcriptional regulator
MTEVQAAAQGGHKTLGIKLPDELHSQLVIIAQLDGQSLTDAIRQAIDYYIERKRGEGDLAARAAQAFEEIEREAAQRREALQALFGQHAQAAASEAVAGTSRRKRAESTP